MPLMPAPMMTYFAEDPVKKLPTVDYNSIEEVADEVNPNVKRRFVPFDFKLKQPWKSVEKIVLGCTCTKIEIDKTDLNAPVIKGFLDLNQKVAEHAKTAEIEVKLQVHFVTDQKEWNIDPETKQGTLNGAYYYMNLIATVPVVKN